MKIQNQKSKSIPSLARSMKRDCTHGSIETKDQIQLKDPAKTEDDDIRAFVILFSRKNREVI